MAQTRPYPEDKSGRRIWLSRPEQATLLDTVADDPQRNIAIWLGLHGLRAEEISKVTASNFRDLDVVDDLGVGLVEVQEENKTGKREVPVAAELRNAVRYSGANQHPNDPVVGVGKRQIHNWVKDAREDAFGDHAQAEVLVEELTSHDLRRTWATDGYYSLAMGGVPIPETLMLSWGGWKQNRTGRSTFREHYLGPVPDHVVAAGVEHLPMSH